MWNNFCHILPAFAEIGDFLMFQNQSAAGNVIQLNFKKPYQTQIPAYHWYKIASSFSFTVTRDSVYGHPHR